jgi:hypothetical protein
VRPEEVERPAVEKEQALRPIDPDVPVEVRAAGPEAGDRGVSALVDGQRNIEEAQPEKRGDERDRGDSERERPTFTRRRLALLLGGYAVGLGGMIATRGLYLSPDRYFLILLVPALALGVARRYVADFLPFIVLIILYEVTRGVAHILRPDPYYAPQLDIDRWLTGTVPTIWLQDRLWDGSLSWWEASLSVLTKLHFIVPPTLLFLIWLRRRELYYRFAATMVLVSFAGAITFAIWPAAPPWMAGRDGWIPKVHRIGYSQVTGVPESTSSWVHQLYDIRNESAAVPSLHAAYALLVVLFCFALGRRAGLCAIPYALGMWFTIVYFGEHYVSDALIGCAYAAIGYVLVGRWWPRTSLAGPFTPPLSRARGAPRG